LLRAPDAYRIEKKKGLIFFRTFCSAVPSDFVRSARRLTVLTDAGSDNLGS
jgi:hypothetical protein